MLARTSSYQSVLPVPKRPKPWLTIISVGLIALLVVGGLAYTRLHASKAESSAALQTQPMVVKPKPVDYEVTQWNQTPVTSPITARPPSLLPTQPIQPQAQPAQAKPAATAKAPAAAAATAKWPSLTAIHHDLDPGPSQAKAHEYTADVASWVPCAVEPRINSDVPGFFTAKVTVPVRDSATLRHVLIPQGAKILGKDNAGQLVLGNERLPTVAVSVALGNGTTVDLGEVPVTDAAGTNGLTGDVNNHWGRFAAAVFVGSALRLGQQAAAVGASNQGGSGYATGAVAGTTTQALQPRVNRAMDTRPTITVDSGGLCQFLLTKPIHLPEFRTGG